MKNRNKTIYGVEPYLALPALVLVSASLLVGVLVRFGIAIPETVLKYLLYANACVVAALALRIGFSPSHHQAITEANTEITGSPFIQFKPKKRDWNDSEWGVFGSKTGRGILRWLGLGSMLVFMIALLFSRMDQTAFPLLIAMSSFLVTILLSMAQLKDHFPSD